MHQLKDSNLRIWTPLLLCMTNLYNGRVSFNFISVHEYMNLVLLIISPWLIFESCRGIILYFYSRVSRQDNFMKRIGMSMCFCMPAAMVIKSGLILLKAAIFHTPPLNPIQLASLSFVSVCTYVCLIIVLYELWYASGRTRLVENEQEELVRVNLQRHYDSLREQVNPHFLFNNLNSLITLISTDPDRAELFIEEMSIVYRYLLRNNTETITPLKEELKFIESYIHLLKTRFGRGFMPSIRIQENDKEKYLPPMTLQLLVENAVKHNIISPDQPLYLLLYTEHDKLIVRNNRQPKKRAEHSNGVGLQNIRNKYQLLKQASVEVHREGGFFTVSVPLIKSDII